MKTLTINSDLQTLLPPLSDAEYKGLEADILEHGCLSPLVVWNETIVDGHNRYAICQDHALAFDTVELDFESLNDAKLWAWQHQEHRRNLTPFQRAEIAQRFKAALTAKAKSRMSAGGSKKCNQESNEGMSTLTDLESNEKSCTVRNQLAEIAGVSNGTMAKVEYLHEHADDETKQRLRDGDTTINREYNRLHSTPNAEFKTGLSKITGPGYVEGEHKSIVLQQILLHDPVSLIECLFAFFDQTYREKLVLGLLERAENEDGREFVLNVTHNILEKFQISQPQ